MTDTVDDQDTDEYGELVDSLEDLEDMADTEEKRRLVRRSLSLARRGTSPVFGRVVRGFDRKDLAEAFVGSVVFGVPMLVEGGTLEIGTFLANHLLYAVSTLLFGVVMVIGILYFADFQQVEVVDPILGVVPRRLAGVLLVAYITSTVMMTAWGRVDWQTPWIAFNQVNVTFVVMAIGAALGDILPGT